MSKQDLAPTAYTAFLEPQDQSGSAGLEKHLNPPASWTQLEFWDKDGKPYLKEYEGRGLLQDKAVLITGGDSGIGRSAAILMAREGADITICYLAEEKEDAEWTIKQIEKEGRKAHGIVGDLKSMEVCKSIIDEHMKVHGRLNVLVNNASMQEACMDHSKIDLDVVQATFQTNIIPMIALAKYALPHMKRGDNIINTASVAGYMGNPALVDYSSTKGAIVSFTRALAQQQAPHGIRVNAVAPGVIWTPLQPATNNLPADAMKGLGINEAPINRPGMPVEIGTAYVFLASPLSSFATGTCHHANGASELQG
nr:hypothetical protein B0A51_14699 [Rachicladosporium sp. CCFEE 5018]